MDNNNNNSNPMGNGPVDFDKFQKLALNYQKIKNQNTILKKAILQEQQKTEDLSKELKTKEQAITTSHQEHDVLDFNNQRLTKRITLLQEQMNEKKESGGSGWGFGFNSKVELQKKEDEINLLRSELQEKIDDNESLHSVTSEKENAFKSIESHYKLEIDQQHNQIIIKDLKIQELENEQKESENKLLQQTQGLRDRIESLEHDNSTIYSSAKLRDDVLVQLNDIVKSNIYNLPTITLDYPIENVTPNSERFSFELLDIDKEFSVGNLQSVIDKSIWTGNIKNIINSFQSLLAYHLTQISNILGSHSLKIKSNSEKFQYEFTQLNDQINKLTLKAEENEFSIKGLKDNIQEKDLLISNLNSKIEILESTITQIDEDNKNYQIQIEKDDELFNSTKSKLELDIKTITNNYENELKQAKDHHQGLLRHQKHSLNSKLEEKDTLINKLEKKVQELNQQIKNNINNSNNSNNSGNNDLIDFGDFVTSSDDNKNKNNNNNNNSNDLVDLSFVDKTNDNGLVKDELIVGEQSDTSSKEGDESTKTTVTTVTTTTTTTDSNSNSNSKVELIPKSDRFKFTVLDDMGEESDSLNFSQTDKERENAMKSYYENKITQLLNKISNIDTKALRYYEQYQHLLKNGKVSEQLQKELEDSKKLLKDTKDELEVTRVNYDQQMRILTEQFISLNDNVSQLDSDIIRIKQHKVTCGKCKTWNILEYIFSPENTNLLCSKGHPIQTIQP